MATTESAAFNTCRACKEKCSVSHCNFHADSNGLSFYKVMVAGFFSYLEVPSDFANNIQCQAYGVASLEGPSGHLWHVKLCHHNSSLYFKDGWKRFISDHSIGAQDILVFKHVLNMYFLVQIFGPTGYEKLSSFTLHNYITSYPGEENLPKDQTKLKAIKEEANVQYSSLYKHGLTIDEPYISSPYEVQERLSHRGSNVQATVSSLPPFIRESLEALVSTGSERTEFRVVLTKCAVSDQFRLSTPTKVAQHWFPNKRTNVFVSDHVDIGKLYAIQFINYSSFHGFTGNWKHVVHANKLEERDTCVFKLVSKEFYIFKLHIVKPESKDNFFQNSKGTAKINTLEIHDKKYDRKSISQSHTQEVQPKYAACMSQGYLSCSETLDQTNFEEKPSVEQGRKDSGRMKDLSEDTRIDVFTSLREKKLNAEILEHRKKNVNERWDSMADARRGRFATIIPEQESPVMERTARIDKKRKRMPKNKETPLR